MARNLQHRHQAEDALHDVRAELELEVRRRTEQLQEHTARLQAMAGQLIQAEERERTRISRLIHDHLQQLLVGALLNLRILKSGNGHPGLADELQAIEDMLKEALDTTQSLTAELSPTVLHQYGLAAALQWLRPWCMEKFQLQVDVDTEDDIDPDPEVSVTLFLCVRELLFNVVKHAGVRCAAVRMWRDPPDCMLKIEISDQGAGFDPHTALLRKGATGGMGLFNSRERVEMLGGGLDIQSAPGRGSRFTLWVPPA